MISFSLLSVPTQSTALNSVDTAKVSVVILEGLIPYLTESDVISTLDALAGLTAPGSTLLLHHIVAPAADARPPSWLSSLRRTGFNIQVI